MKRWTARWLVSVVDPLGPNDQDPDAVRTEACRLVSRDQSVCSAAAPPPKPRTPSGLNLDWLAALLWVIVIAVAIVALVVIIRALVGRKGKQRKKRRKKSGDEEDLDQIEESAVSVDLSREPTNWRAEAEVHRREGRYRDAVRCQYRALVGDLARRGLIDEIPGRTTGEERTQLWTVSPQLGEPFTAAADLFDDAWYGHAPVDGADDERFQEFEREVLTARGSRR